MRGKVSKMVGGRVVGLIRIGLEVSGLVVPLETRAGTCKSSKTAEEGSSKYRSRNSGCNALAGSCSVGDC